MSSLCQDRERWRELLRCGMDNFMSDWLSKRAVKKAVRDAKKRDNVGGAGGENAEKRSSGGVVVSDVVTAGREFDSVHSVVVRGTHITIGRGGRERVASATGTKIKESHTTRMLRKLQTIGVVSVEKGV